MSKLKKDQIENCISFSISILSTFSVITNWRMKETANLLFYYFVFDIFLFKKNMDIIVHHILIMSTYVIAYFFSIRSEDFMKIYKIIIWVEISNIFLLSKKNILDKKNKYFDKIRPVNDFLFIVTFLYFRIFHYYYYLLLPNKISNDVLENYSDDKLIKYFYWANIYGFFILNSYWSFLIFKKIYIKLSETIKSKHITFQSTIKNEKLCE